MSTIPSISISLIFSFGLSAITLIIYYLSLDSQQNHNQNRRSLDVELNDKNRRFPAVGFSMWRGGTINLIDLINKDKISLPEKETLENKEPKEVRQGSNKKNILKAIMIDSLIYNAIICRI